MEKAGKTILQSLCEHLCPLCTESDEEDDE